MKPFTIITTLSPDYARAERELLPTWCANSGAAEIVVHRIDEGSWERNIAARATIIRDELLARLPTGERVLSLDIDCLVLRDLSSGFSDRHLVSVARWPSPQMGVVFFNLAVPFEWATWLTEIHDEIQREVKRQVERGRNPMHELDQKIWRPRLFGIRERVRKLPDYVWNYSDFDLANWRRDLPGLQPLLRVAHLKGHGDFCFARLAEKIAVAKTIWPKELACIG